MVRSPLSPSAPLSPRSRSSVKILSAARSPLTVCSSSPGSLSASPPAPPPPLSATTLTDEAASDEAPLDDATADEAADEAAADVAVVDEATADEAGTDEAGTDNEQTVELDLSGWRLMQSPASSTPPIRSASSADIHAALTSPSLLGSPTSGATPIPPAPPSFLGSPPSGATPIPPASASLLGSPPSGATPIPPSSASLLGSPPSGGSSAPPASQVSLGSAPPAHSLISWPSLNSWPWLATPVSDSAVMAVRWPLESRVSASGEEISLPVDFGGDFGGLDVAHAPSTSMANLDDEAEVDDPNALIESFFEVGSL
eukprot:jgi/Chrpa1/21619/Chrysochromulina_OHIO_Genome00028163-RA